MNIEGKVVLITGSNRGIGAALVEAFVAAGAKKVYAARRTATLPDPGSNVVPIELDITDAHHLARAAEQLDDVDVLVNNAGISTGQPLLGAVDLGAADREMRVNYFGTLDAIRAFAPALRKRRGAIVNILSILSRVSLPPVGSYSASKAAALSLTQGIRAELAGDGVHVMGVLPGFVDTDMTERVTAPKITPREVADQVIEGLRRDSEEVYPGPAADVAAELLRDPKAVERGMAGLLRPPPR